jgi:N,N'-diacetyllegionaminate synthase
LNRTFIIAEAGVNHNGSINTAFKMVDAASEAGADAVKFQTFRAEKVISADAPKARYQEETTGNGESQLEMVRKFELDELAHKHLFDYCRQRGIQFLSTPFDLESIDLLVRLGLTVFKIASGEITNLPYLRKLGALKKRLIISTGMADLKEVGDALLILMNEGTPLADITVLHCNTEYPTPFEDVNLKAMITIGIAYPGIEIGYSDHTLGIEVPIAAVAFGAKVIEKHFTLDRKMEGPDHKASLQPHELKSMISCIRNVERALGNGVKKPSPSELKNKSIARKSIVAARVIDKGEIFTQENLTTKRPGTGISPMNWDRILGMKANRCYRVDELIDS